MPRPVLDRNERINKPAITKRATGADFPAIPMRRPPRRRLSDRVAACGRPVPPGRRRPRLAPATVRARGGGSTGAVPVEALRGVGPREDDLRALRGRGLLGGEEALRAVVAGDRD